MTVHSMPFTPSSAEQSAWVALVGQQPIPESREEMTAIAREVWERRLSQNQGNLEVLGTLTALAETLDVFGGSIDTQTHPEIFKSPASLPKGFRRVESERLSRGRYGDRKAAGEED